MPNAAGIAPTTATLTAAGIVQTPATFIIAPTSTVNITSTAATQDTPQNPQGTGGSPRVVSNKPASGSGLTNATFTITGVGANIIGILPVSMAGTATCTATGRSTTNVVSAATSITATVPPVSQVQANVGGVAPTTITGTATVTASGFSTTNILTGASGTGSYVLSSIIPTVSRTLNAILTSQAVVTVAGYLGTRIASGAAASIVGDASAVGFQTRLKYLDDTAPTVDTATYSVSYARATPDSAATPDQATVLRNASGSAAIRNTTDSASTTDQNYSVNITPQVGTATVSGTATLIGYQSYQAIFPLRGTERLPLDDTLTWFAVNPRQPSDSAATGEYANRSFAAPRYLRDATGGNDTGPRLLAQTRSNVESAPAVEVGTAREQLRAASVDAAGGVDSVTFVVQHFGGATDAAPAVDTAVQHKLFTPLLFDDAPVSDAVVITAHTGSAQATDTAPATDVPAQTAARPRSATDAVPVSDVAHESGIHFAFGSDQIGGADTNARTTARSRYTANSLPLTDAGVRYSPLFRSRTDSAPTSETLTAQFYGVYRGADTFSTTDTTTGFVRSGRFAADTTTISDSASGYVSHTRTASMTDTATTTDSATSTYIPKPVLELVYSRQASDTAHNGDVGGAQGKTTTGRFASDTAGATDSAARAYVVPARSAADTAPTTETTVGAFSRIRFATDALPISDALVRSQSSGRMPADTASTSDVVTAFSPRTRAAADGVAGTDAVLVIKSFPRAAADSLPATDALSPFRIAYVRTEFDNAAAADALVVHTVEARSAADTFSTTDAVTRTFGVVRTTTDAAPNDAATVHGRFRLVYLNDSLPIRDRAVVVASPFVRAATDSTATLEATTLGLASRRTTSDAITLTDSGQGARVFFRTLIDYLPTPETITRYLNQMRSKNELIGGSDGTTGYTVGYRSLTEPTSLADLVTTHSVASRSITDQAQATDISSRSAPLFRMCSEAIGGIELLAPRAVNLLRDAVDTVGGLASSDRLATSFSVALSDALGGVDAVARALQAFMRRTKDAAIATDLNLDSQGVNALRTRFTADVIFGTEAVVTRTTADRSTSEATGTYDSATGPAAQARSFSEIAGAVDAVVRALTQPRNVAELPIPTTDLAHGLVPGVARYGIEPTLTLDIGGGNVHDYRQSADSDPADDGLARVRVGLTRFNYESVGGTEVLGNQRYLHFSLSEDAFAFDIPSYGPGLNRANREAAGGTDRLDKVVFSSARMGERIGPVDKARWTVRRATLPDYEGAPSGLPADPVGSNMGPHQENSSFRSATQGTFEFPGQGYAPRTLEVPDSHPVTVIPDPGKQPTPREGRATIVPSSSSPAFT